MSVIKEHDFRCSETLDRQYVRALNVTLDTFARHGSVELSTSLRKTIQLNVESMREMSWRQIVGILTEQPYLAAFNLEPLHGTAILSLPLQTASRIIDFRLGGGAQAAYGGHHALTETDLTVLSAVIEPLLADLATRLSKSERVSASLVAQESTIQFAQLVGANEMFLVAGFGLQMGSDAPTQMQLALPFGLVRQITEAMHSRTLSHEQLALMVDESVVLQTPVEVRLELPTIRLSSDEIAELEEGDVIRFSHLLHEPLDLRAEGVLVGKAREGTVGSKIVCSITEEISTDDN